MKKVQPDLDFTLVNNFDDLNSKDQLLIQKAKEASKNAYAPYSQFFVGASLELESGEIHSANNQENAAYPSGLCAERVLLFHVGSNFPGQTIKTIAVVAVINNNLVAATPCGACRQVMVEYEQKQQDPIRIIMYTGEDEIIISKNASSLLPFTFNSKSLLNY